MSPRGIIPPQYILTSIINIVASLKSFSSSQDLPGSQDTFQLTESHLSALVNSLLTKRSRRWFPLTPQPLLWFLNWAAAAQKKIMVSMASPIQQGLQMPQYNLSLDLSPVLIISNWSPEQLWCKRPCWRYRKGQWKGQRKRTCHQNRARKPRTKGVLILCSTAPLLQPFQCHLDHCRALRVKIHSQGCPTVKHS